MSKDIKTIKRDGKIFDDVRSFCNVYCAIEMQGKSTNCIELYDGLNYILKLKK